MKAHNKAMLLCKFSLCTSLQTFIFAAVILHTNLILSSSYAQDVSYSCPDLEVKSKKSNIGTALHQGKEGWFARSSDLDMLFENSNDVNSFLLRIQAVLAQKNINLLLMPMIPRGIFGEKFLPADGFLYDLIYDRDFAAQQFNEYVQRLGKMGLPTVNVISIVKNSNFDDSIYYFKRDHHWTSEGARVVATGVAAHIAEAFEGIKYTKKSYKSVIKQYGLKLFSLFGRSVSDLCKDKIPSETVNVYQTKEDVASLDDAFGSPATDEEFLHVIGTSFTDETMFFNFDGFLREATRGDVKGYSIKGGGVEQSLYKWALDTYAIAHSPKILLWEYTNVGSMNEKHVFLERQALPAVMGICGGDTLSIESQFEAGSHVSINVAVAKASGWNNYVAFDFQNNALTKFNLKFDFADGTSEKNIVEMPSRVQNLTKLFYELPHDNEAELTNVTLDIIAGNDSSGTFRLCHYPEGTFDKSKS